MTDVGASYQQWHRELCEGPSYWKAFEAGYKLGRRIRIEQENREETPPLKNLLKLQEWLGRLSF